MYNNLTIDTIILLTTSKRDSKLYCESYESSLTLVIMPQAQKIPRVIFLSFNISKGKHFDMRPLKHFFKIIKN